MAAQAQIFRKIMASVFLAYLPYYNFWYSQSVRKRVSAHFACETSRAIEDWLIFDRSKLVAFKINWSQLEINKRDGIIQFSWPDGEQILATIRRKMYGRYQLTKSSMHENKLIQWQNTSNLTLLKVKIFYMRFPT